jgi:uncharacterized protein DUF4189
MISYFRPSLTVCLLLAAALSLWLSASQAHAEGAVALGLPSDVAKQGVAIFTYVDASTQDEAKAQALSGCKSLEGASSTSRALCKVIATFKNQCVAEAIDPKDGTPGFGWAMASNSAQAREQALSNCRDTAGPGRQDACIVSDQALWCDGTAK